MSSATETNTQTAKLELPGHSLELPITVGSEGEHAVDISKLRGQTSYITKDPAYGNTGSCESAITYIDGENGILRYRGYPIEQLAANSTFVETAWLLINGELPNADQLDQFSHKLTDHQLLHEGLRNAFDGFPSKAPPMAILSAMINAVSCYNPDVTNADDPNQLDDAAARLISKVRTIAAAAYKTSIGQPIMYPRKDLKYASNFLHMMFSTPHNYIDPDPDLVKVLNQVLILHADHEQNCSTSTVRMVGSSGANLFASCSAGVLALWGWRHGGANVAVLNMLEYITENEIKLEDFIEQVKKKEVKLMGFGHRVYKSYDPRAKILQEAADVVLAKLGVSDPMIDMARRIEEVALNDDYFVSRNLYPNVDFYSGMIMRAMGIPTDMFTVMFAIGRMPGWIAQYKELVQDPTMRISRPRQIYTGENERDYVAMNNR